MNRNGYLNFVATALVIAVVVIGYALIKSVDTLRFRTEKVSEQLSNIQSRMDDLEKRIAEKPQVVYQPSQANGQQTQMTTEAVANLEFFKPEADDGGRLIDAIMSETQNMNYMINNESFVGSLWDFCNDSIASRNYKDVTKFEPQLAESWSLSEDKMVYTVKLRKGILWHDFTDPVTKKVWKDVEVTAQDFKFYVDVIKNPDTNCAPYRSYFEDLDKIEVISDYEFKVHWKKKYFLSESITMGLTPLPRHLYHAYDGPFDGKKFNDDHQRNRLIVGCGPYRFVKWDKGQRIVLKRWKNYYGRSLGTMPHLETMVFDVIKHPNSQLQALKSSKIDRMGFTPDQWVMDTNTKEFGDDGFIRKLKYTSRSYSYVGYNLKNPLFQDKRVRQALTHLIDRKRILKDVFHDLGRIVTGNFFIDSPYYDHSIAPFPFSVERAKELFAEAGWKDTDGDGILDKDGKKFIFTMMGISSHPTQRKMLQIMKEDMAKGGVDMRIANLEWSVYVQRLEKKNFDVCSLGWGMGFESDPKQIWHSEGADQEQSSNHIGFKNAKADKLIEEIRVTFDLKKRIELCHKFHQLLHDEQPYTFLFSRYSLLGLNSRYENVHVFPVGVPTRILWVPKGKQEPIPGL